METNFHRGSLKTWNDNKGFGFIKAENDKKDIFIHITALKKMSRRPIVGDIINYQIHTDNYGKSRAVNARIEGVAEIQPRRKPNKNTNRNKHLAINFRVSSYNRKYSKTFGQVLDQLSVFVAIALLIVAAYNTITGTESSPITYKNPSEYSEYNEQTVVLDEAEDAYYSCDGKVYCSEMTSCEEAMFYQNNCFGTKMDGDGDGIPCESQWCGR